MSFTWATMSSVATKQTNPHWECVDLLLTSKPATSPAQCMPPAKCCVSVSVHFRHTHFQISDYSGYSLCLSKFQTSIHHPFISFADCLTFSESRAGLDVNFFAHQALWQEVSQSYLPRNIFTCNNFVCLSTVHKSGQSTSLWWPAELNGRRQRDCRATTHLHSFLLVFRGKLPKMIIFDIRTPAIKKTINRFGFKGSCLRVWSRDIQHKAGYV